MEYTFFATCDMTLTFFQIIGVSAVTILLGLAKVLHNVFLYHDLSSVLESDEP